ncbi:hypothetical protein SAMN04487910_1538 [Aquimarina amphilecti]|uniref:Uncharacterized protein n=1 Tax=Aquimarina amphilecti TaxID=1038014 RepID=A0A1H7L640_AQUAM|nr:hypothetical protein [Aquimarina amphilecti]SEK94471.1 hypothetical protein SAMN04487910_1538 [Aquimarina amphilecti]
MKNTTTSLILQIVALLFLVVIGYLIFNSSSNWKVITSELNKAREELKQSKEVIVTTKSQLESSRKEFEQMKTQKDLIIHKRDSLILSFKRKNAKDWSELQQIKDSIKITNDQLSKDRAILNGVFGLEQ